MKNLTIDVARPRHVAGSVMPRIGLLLMAAAALAGCVGDPRPPETGDGAMLYRDHPLAGRIWRPATGRFVTADEVVAAMETADFVLLGEKHDNPDHHAIQAWLLRRMTGSGRKPAVAFEMITQARQAVLDDYLAGASGDSEGLGAAIDWAESGWPDWAMYQPVAEAALTAGAPLLAAGTERSVTRGVARGGPASLGRARVRDLRLDDPPPAPLRAVMRIVIDESHCGMLPDSMFDPMVDVTLVKDAVMARTLIDGAGLAGRDGAVLIAGDGHVRADFGVPWHLGRLAPGRRTVTVGLLEVVADAAGPGEYAEAYGGELPYGFVWFTPRVDDEDPCEAFAGQLRRAGKGKTPP